MKHKLLSDKYCSAFLSSLSKEERGPVLKESIEIISAILKSHNTWTVVQSPLCGTEEREQLIFNVLDNSKQHPKLKNLFRLLIAKKRLPILSDLLKSFEEALLKESNEKEVTISTAQELSDTEKKEILSLINEKTNANLTPSFRVDTTLLAGFKAQVGELVFEGSLQNSLQKLENQLCGIGS